MPENPLTEVQESMNELFSRDALKLTDGDIDKMVEILRRDQDLYMQKEKIPKKKLEAPTNLKLEDLDL